MHAPPKPTHAEVVNILDTLRKLHNDLAAKTREAHQLQMLPGNSPPANFEFFMQLGKVLEDCATDADRLRIRIERDRTNEDLVETVTVNRREDLATMIRYLDKVAQQVADLVGRYEAEIEKQASHREREQKSLDTLDAVLDHYK